MANGWQTFGAVLGGGAQQTANMYNTGMVQGAQAADLLEQAAERRNKNVSMQALTGDLVQRAQAGDVAAQAQLEATAASAGIDPRQFTGAAKDQQGVNFGNTAMGLAMAPTIDYNRLNAVNMVRDGKPVDLSAVQGNTLINQMVTPDQQTAQGGNVPTALGQAMIGTQGAEAAAANARAADSYANAARAKAGIGADKASNYVLTTGKDGNLYRVNKLDPTDAQAVTQQDGTPLAAAMGGRGIGSPEKVTPTLYEQTFGKSSTSGGPNAKTQQFLAYRALHPELSESDALQQFELADQNAPEGATELTLGDGIPLNPAQVKAQQTGKAVLDVKGNVLASPRVFNGMAAAMNGTAAPAAPAAAGPSMPKSRAEFDALPKGATFINPADGRLMVKK